MENNLSDSDDVKCAECLVVEMVVHNPNGCCGFKKSNEEKKIHILFRFLSFQVCMSVFF